MNAYLSAVWNQVPVWNSTCMLVIFPFVVYAVVAPRKLTGRAWPITAYAVLIGLCLYLRQDAVGTVLSHVFAFGYFTLAALATCQLAMRWRRDSAARRLALFSAACIGFVLVPGLLFPSPVNLIAVPLGWELALAAYSYVVEARAQSPAVSMEAGLFFLLVNPALVYPERGQPCADGPRLQSGLLRCASGLALAGSQSLVLATLQLWQGRLQLFGQLGSGGSAVSYVLYYGSLLVAAYGLYAGVAGVRIGTMLILGYEVPERYDAPWRARNPAEFWRRWNTYVGGWAKRYLFIPVATRLRRRLSGVRAGAWSMALAVIATFSVVGIYHDFGLFAQYGVWPLGGLRAFLVHALALLSWVTVAGMLRTAATRLHAPHAVLIVSARIAPFAFLCMVLFTAWLTVPTPNSVYALTIDNLLENLRPMFAGR